MQRAQIDALGFRKPPHPWCIRKNPERPKRYLLRATCEGRNLSAGRNIGGLEDDLGLTRAAGRDHGDPVHIALP
jgi:hypothetical protein